MNTDAARSAGEAEREKLAKRFERHSRHTLFAIVPIGLIAVIDLATGSLTGDHNIDYGLLAITAMSLYSVFLLRRLAGRFRRNDFPQRATPMLWLKSIGSIVTSLAVSAGIGYLVGGWVLAVVIPMGAAVTITIAVVVGRRRRRRVRAHLPT